MNVTRTLPANEPNQQLPVRVRRTVHGDGSVETSLSTFCRSRARSVSLDECLHCADLKGLSIESGGEDAFVRCTAQADTPPRALHSTPESSRIVRGGFGADVTTLGEIMTRDVTCVTADLSIEDLTRLLLERNISGVPVVDASGRPIGVISKTDLLREFSERDGNEQVEPARCEIDGIEAELGAGFHVQRLASATVADAMMPVPFSFEETETIAAAAALMAAENVHRIPVLSHANGSVVGIVSSIDVLGWLASQYGYLVPRRR
jgi:CBS domain-containing protein